MIELMTMHEGFEDAWNKEREKTIIENLKTIRGSKEEACQRKRTKPPQSINHITSSEMIG